MTTAARYVNAREDSRRWEDISLRPGDIIVSTPPKAGTTWLQTICALLVFQRPDFPATLDDLSPWLDLKMAPIESVRGQLEQQDHRRFIKTHTPLDGLPFRDDVHYLVGARHPLDAAVSTYYQWHNIDLDVVRQALGVTAEQFPNPAAGLTLTEWLSAWVHEEVEDRRGDPHSLEGMMWHYSDAWRRKDLANVVLVHYDDLSVDLPGQMRTIAERLSVDVPPERWAGLVDAATFGQMRGRAENLVPRVVPFKSSAAFFREGRSGVGLAAVQPDDRRHFLHRVEGLAEPQLLRWLLR